MTKKPTESLSLQVAPELKCALRKQAKRAGVSLSEWVRTRLELEGTNPDEMRAFLKELAKLGKRVERSNAEFKVWQAKEEVRERERPAKLEAIRAKAAHDTLEAIERGELDLSRLFGGDAPH